MNCPKYWPGIIRCPESGSYGLRLWKWLATGFIIGLLWGVVAGYAWHYAQVTDEHIAKVKKMLEKIDHYQTHWTPIKEKEVRASVRRK